MNFSHRQSIMPSCTEVTEMNYRIPTSKLSKPRAGRRLGLHSLLLLLLVSHRAIALPGKGPDPQDRFEVPHQDSEGDLWGKNDLGILEEQDIHFKVPTDNSQAQGSAVRNDGIGPEYGSDEIGPSYASEYSIL